MDEVYERFASLMEQRGVTAYQVAKETGISTAVLSSWKAGRWTPKHDKIQKIADYFGVPLDYIMTGRMPTEGGYYLDDDTAEIAQQIYNRPELRTLFDASRKASKEDVEFVVNMLQRLYEKEHPED